MEEKNSKKKSLWDFDEMLFSIGLKTVGLFGAIGEFSQPYEERNVGVILGCAAIYTIGELYKRCVNDISHRNEIRELEKRLKEEIEKGFLDIKERNKSGVQQDSTSILNYLNEGDKHYSARGL